MNILPVKLDDLINSRAVESIRREFKRSWSATTLEQVVRTICAFANDFFNLNGGYILIGIEEKDGLPVLPPHGLEGENLDEIQKQIRGQCKRIDPEYQPVISPEIYQGKPILVVWAPGGDVRPYQAPRALAGRERAYFVRLGSETIEAQGDLLTQLMQMTAKTPFDDRRNASATLEVISPALVRNFLSDIGSDLVSPGVNVPDVELYRSMRLLSRVNDHDVPRNIALLFFTNDPADFFPGTRMEVVQFGGDAGGDLIEEKVFNGPLHLQIRQVLDYLESFSTKMIRKIPGRAEAQRTVAFPYEAMEEAVVNAVYHRGYEGVPEPTKIYLYPDRMEITSYPGPVPGLEPRHFQRGAALPPVANRNRRIGEFLKELRLAEGRGTGIPKIHHKMSENGSPEPVFEFDEARSYFRVTLPAHPQYIVIHALREAAHSWAVGERGAAIETLRTAAQRVPKSGALIAQLIDYETALGQFSTAEKLFTESKADPTIVDRHLPFMAMAKVFLTRQNPRRALEILSASPPPLQTDDLVELAVLHKRAGQLEKAHRIFTSNYELIKDDPKAIHEFAQTKLKLAASLKPMPRQNLSTKKRLTQEAVELLRRVIQLSDDRVRKAWSWFDLTKALSWLRAPETEILKAYAKAIELLPDEPHFVAWHDEWQRHRGKDHRQK